MRRGASVPGRAATPSSSTNCSRTTANAEDGAAGGRARRGRPASRPARARGRGGPVARRARRPRVGGGDGGRGARAAGGRRARGARRRRGDGARGRGGLAGAVRLRARARGRDRARRPAGRPGGRGSASGSRTPWSAGAPRGTRPAPARSPATCVRRVRWRRRGAADQVGANRGRGGHGGARARAGGRPLRGGTGRAGGGRGGVRRRPAMGHARGDGRRGWTTAAADRGSCSSWPAPTSGRATGGAHARRSRRSRPPRANAVIRRCSPARRSATAAWG